MTTKSKTRPKRNGTMNGTTNGTVNRTTSRPKSSPRTTNRTQGANNGTTKTRVRDVATAVSEREAIQELLQTQPHSMEDYVVRIRALGIRISEYVQFMGAVEGFNGSCIEAKHKSISLFYEKLVYMDRELERIQEELRLG